MFKNPFTKKKEVVAENQPICLPISQHGQTRELWELIFTEDSKEFVDYYYREKINENIIFIIQKEHKIASMLQLNPYPIHLKDSIVPAHFIVGVATKAEFRREGLMRQMLRHAMQEMYQNKECFSYLMPAKVEYYEPFDFTVVYEQRSGILESIGQMECELSCLPAEQEDYKELALFLEEKLQNEYGVYTAREEENFPTLKHQFQSEHGDLMLVRENQRLVGYFLYGEYDDIEIMEPICEKGYEPAFLQAIEQYFSEKKKRLKLTAFSEAMEKWMQETQKKPTIMFRIINLEMLSRYLRSKEEIEMVIDIKDPLIPQNNGTFLFQISSNRGMMTKTERKAEGFCTIEELTRFLYTNESFGNENIQKKCESLQRFAPVFINELV